MSMPNSKTKHIGIYGGTFDPIHLGHINSAKHIAKWLNLSEITLLPSHIPPHKSTTHANPVQRREMVNRVENEHSVFTVDSRELKKTTPSYTVETLEAFKHEHPDSTLYFLIGMDSLQTFTSWYRWQDILKLAHLVVSTRPGYQHKNNCLATQNLLKECLIRDISTRHILSSGGIFLAPEQNWCISSTEIRMRIKSQQPHQHLISNTVFDYIKQQQLYR